MKKFFLGAAALAVMAGVFSCGNTGSANLKTDADSAAYALGVMQASRGVVNPYTGAKLDSVQFIRGLKDGFEAAKKDTTGAYAQGLQLASQLAEVFTKENMDPAIFISAFESVIKGDTTNLKIKSADAQAVLEAFGQKIQAREAEKQYGANKKKGEEYMAEFKKQEGVTTTPSGLAYIVLKEGTGATPKATDKVRVHYHGTLIDGTVFDSSVDRGEPTEFPLGGVIKGWTEMLQLMKVGEKVKVVIPQDLAYGANSQYPIEPFSTLTFEIELLDILPAEAAAPAEGELH